MDETCVKGNHPFAVALRKSIVDYKEAQRIWVESLKLLGVKMAHPDDGWVDRVLNRFHPCYPDFGTELEVGDKIALGDSVSYRIVTVVKKGRGIFSMPGKPFFYYDFE